jgi:predicted glycoside hydrolase/deacetylase ChbG (UPF0249 family)
MPAITDTTHSACTRPRLIITADDFGRDEVCTAAIAEHLEAGRITATSIMANGRCFEKACELARARGLQGMIGLHLVLDEGPPLSQDMRAFTDAAGNLCVSRKLTRLSRALASAIEAECVAQIERVMAAGFRLTHIDSHRHVHTRFPIGRLVVNVARRFAIAYVRPARNLLPARNFARTLYKALFNRYLASRAGTADYFADIEDFFQQRYTVRPHSLIECMIHLDASARGRSGQQLLLDPAFQRFLSNYELVGHVSAGS